MRTKHFVACIASITAIFALVYFTSIEREIQNTEVISVTEFKGDEAVKVNGIVKGLNDFDNNVFVIYCETFSHKIAVFIPKKDNVLLHDERYAIYQRKYLPCNGSILDQKVTDNINYTLNPIQGFTCFY